MLNRNFSKHFASKKKPCQVFHALQVVKSNLEGTTHLAAAQEEHHGLFVACYPGHVRPKHHLRLHLPSQYERFGVYIDMFPTETRHKLYKGMLADCLEHMFHEKDGNLSLAVLGRMLNMITQQLVDYEWCHEMLSPIYSAEDVEKQMPGTNAEVSGGFSMGSLQIKRDQVLLWHNGAGIVSLFAKNADQVVMVFEKLTPTAVANCCKRKFTQSGMKHAIDIHELHRCHHPNWWHIADDYVICL